MMSHSRYLHLNIGQLDPRFPQKPLDESSRIDAFSRHLEKQGAFMHFPYQWDAESETPIPSHEQASRIGGLLDKVGYITPVSINLTNRPVSPKTFAALIAIAKKNSLSAIDLSGTDLTAQQLLTLFSSCSSIVHGCFANTAFNDTCLECLISKHHVKTLAIQDTNITAKQPPEINERFPGIRIITN